MQFSSNTFTTFVPEEIRSAYDDLKQNEIAAQGPSAGVKALFSDEPEQLSFSFKLPKE
jgi:hypothetical protein